jgi:hypothetical protein
MTTLGRERTGRFEAWSLMAALSALVVSTSTVDVAAAAPASGKGRSPILVIESHTGARPPEVASLIEKLDDELEQRGFAAKPATILRLASGLPRPGVLDQDVTPAKIARDVDTGYDLFTTGGKDSYRKAVAVLAPAVEALKRNPGLVVLNTSNVDVMQKAYLTLALCQAYLGDADWLLTMTEEIRMFPTRAFPLADYGPSDEKIYKKAYKQAQSMGRGRLVIASGNRQAVIFVDGQIRAVDKVSLADLIPGAYHVFIQIPGTPGRQYEVDVTAGDDAFLSAEAELDASLLATDSWIGFLFGSLADRAKEARFAGRFATRCSDRDLVGVVGTLRHNGRLMLTGSVYTTDGILLRGMAFDVLTAKPDSPRELAQLMAEGGVPTDGIVMLDGAAPTPTLRAEAKAPDAPWWRRPSPYLIGGGAVMLASTAAYLIAPKDDFTAPTYDDRRTPAVRVFVGGSVVFGVGAYLWVRRERSGGVVAAAAIGSGVAMTLSGALLIATDEDEHSQGYQRPTYRDTATMGVVLGAAGLASTALGAVLLYRDRSPPVMPVATVADHHVLFSLNGAF